jgi:hypothetical protein
MEISVEVGERGRGEPPRRVNFGAEINSEASPTPLLQVEGGANLCKIGGKMARNRYLQRCGAD